MAHDPAIGTDYLCSAILDLGPRRHATFTVGMKIAATQRRQVICEKSLLDLSSPSVVAIWAPTEILIDSYSGLETSAPIRHAMLRTKQYPCEVTHFAKVLRGHSEAAWCVDDAIKQAQVIDALFASARRATWQAAYPKQQDLINLAVGKA